MSKHNQQELPLSHYRVLDLADEKGFFCGKVLADLGADVIKIESPGGDAARRIDPFYHDIPAPEKSLHWFAFNANKRGITLNLETKDGRGIFKKLAKTADFVVESFPPGYLEKLGLGYPVLSQINPRLIVTSITPFGQTGPYRDYKVTDFTAMAMSGLVFVTGDPDRPPVCFSVPQAYLHAGLQAAAGTMIAHYSRELTGKGQWVDVSIQRSVYWTAFPQPRITWEFAKAIRHRIGGLHVGAVRINIVWRCQDGHVSLRIITGVGSGQKTRHLVEWMNSEGIAGDLMALDWEAIDMVNVTQQEADHWQELIARFFLKHTKKELFDGAARWDVMLFPVYTTADLPQDEQLKARNYFTSVEHPELGTSITYCGAPYKSTEYEPTVRFRAPLIGEHNEQIYIGELGFSKAQLVALNEANVI